MIRTIWFFEDSIEIPGGASDKKPPANLGDAQEVGSIPGLKRSPGVRNGNPFQYSCLENFHEQKSLAGYGPRSCKVLDMTERLNTNTEK